MRRRSKTSNTQVTHAEKQHIAPSCEIPNKRLYKTLLKNVRPAGLLRMKGLSQTHQLSQTVLPSVTPPA